MNRLTSGSFFGSVSGCLWTFVQKYFYQNCRDSNIIVIFTYNLKTKQMDKPKEKPKCQHTKTYVAVRHVSGLTLVKCADCGQVL